MAIMKGKSKMRKTKMRRFLEWIYKVFLSFGYCPNCEVEFEPTAWQSLVCPTCGYDAFAGKVI